MLNPQTGELFIVDKPYGWSSFHVVKKLRGALTSRMRQAGIKKLKVGHAGTLDPLATGVMILCTGKMTRRIDELQAGVKEYLATIQLGATTPSFDLETPVDASFPTAHINRELIESVLPQFVGRIEQVPPEYSACKIDGDRAYKLARSGKEVQLKPKTLVIDKIELTEFDADKMLLSLRIICSKGTYIRALARDIGLALGSGGHLSALRRTRVGDQTIDRALTIEEAVRLIYESPLEVVTDPDAEPRLLPAGMAPDQIMTNEKADIKPYDQRR